MKKAHATQERSHPKKEKSFLISVSIGLIVTLLSGTVLLVLSCFPALMLEDPLRFAPAFAIASLFLSTILGSYLSSHIYGKNGLACGAVCAFLIVLFIVALTLILEWPIRTTIFSICAPALFICAMIAGICGVSAERTKKPRHKIKF